MSYDGYGRLKTKHVPEQDANTETDSVGITGIHETFHAAASRGLYKEPAIAGAAFEVGKSMGLLPDLVGAPRNDESEDADSYNTRLIDSTIFAACGRR